MKYVGRAPTSDFSVTTKKTVDDRHSAIAVDDDWLASATAASATDLVTPAYVDQQDGLRATKTAVDNADAGYLALSAKGAANGVASIGSDGFIPSAQIPSGLPTRKPFFKNVDQTFLTAQRVVTTQTPREYEAARLTIADPGFPYIPVPFASVLGGSLNGTLNGQQLGTANFAQLSIFDASNVKWGWCITGNNKTMMYHTCLPFADSTINPTSRPAVNGALTLSLWLACWTGNTYTFDPTGLQFHCMIYPARV